MNRMLADIVKARKPVSATVVGDFTPRGGISTRITAQWARKKNNVTDEELTAAIQEVQQRARSRVPQGSLGLDGVAAADLMPLVHARDAAEAKVAAIGTVNPRPPDSRTRIIQRFKRLVARALDWHVREQVEFNRAAMTCVQATSKRWPMSPVAIGGSHHETCDDDLRQARDRSAACSTEAQDQQCAHWKWSKPDALTEFIMNSDRARIQEAFRRMAHRHRRAPRSERDPSSAHGIRASIGIPSASQPDRAEFPRIRSPAARRLHQRIGSAHNRNPEAAVGRHGEDPRRI